MTKKKNEKPPRVRKEEDEDPEEENKEEEKMDTRKDDLEAEPEVEEEEEEEEFDQKAVMEKMVKALELMKRQNADLRKEVRELKKDEPYPEKGPNPPEFPDGMGDDASEDNPEEEEGGEPPSKYTEGAVQESDESASDPGTKWDDDDDSRIPKSGDGLTADQVEQIVAKALAQQREELKKEVPRLVKASTPLPPGFSNTPAMRGLFQKAGHDRVGALTDLVQKAILEDRKLSGGNYSASSAFGIRKGTEQDHYKLNRKLQKMYFGG